MERKEEMKKDRETERGGRSKFFGFFSFFFFFNRVRSKVCCYLFWWYGRVQGVEAPDRWKWTFSHLPSRRYHTRVSSLCCVCACPCLKSNSIKFKKNPIKFPPRSETTRKTIGRSNSLVHELSQTDVCNAGGILAHQMDVRVEDQCVDWFAILA